MAKTPTTTDAPETTDAPAKAKKAKVCDKVYIDGAGEESRHAGPESETLEFRFDNGHKVPVILSDFPKNVLAAVAWHGLSQKLGDSYAGGDGLDEKIENFESLLERLKAGDWVKARESAGPRISLLLVAVCNVLTANGETVDDDRRAGVAEKLKDKTNREGALANPVFKVEYEKLRLEAQQARVAKLAAKAAAEGAETSLGGF